MRKKMRRGPRVQRRQDLRHDFRAMGGWRQHLPGTDIDSWANQYETTNMMSDQIGPLVWPLPYGGAIWVGSFR